jgi:hypothetical protein
VGDMAKFPYFCFWKPFGLWLKFSEVYLGCNVLLQGIITCVNAMLAPGVGLGDVPLGA